MTSTTKSLNAGASNQALMALGMLSIAGYLVTTTSIAALQNNIVHFDNNYTAAPTGYEVRTDSLHALMQYAQTDALPASLNDNLIQQPVHLALNPNIEDSNIRYFADPSTGYHVTSVGFGARTERMEYEQNQVLYNLDREAKARQELAKTILTSVGINPGMVAQTTIPNEMQILPGYISYQTTDPSFGDRVIEVTNHITQARGIIRTMLSAPFGVPLHSYRETSNFGNRIDPFTGRDSFHPGIDMAIPEGTPIHPTNTGTVSFAGWENGYGNCVEIDHGNGFKTRYGHMSAILVHEGQHVTETDTIGRVGSTGRSTAPHLHYEVWFRGRLMDPANFLETGRRYFRNG